jgi:deoxyribonuclease-4
MARQLDVRLSMHTPYYMDLASNSEMTQRSMDNMRWAAIMTHHMGGDIVVTHQGLYGDLDKKDAVQNITENISMVMGWWEDSGLSPKLGLETSGRQEVFGSLDEILEISDMVKGVVPVINFAHLHARESGLLREPEDFADVLDRARDHVGPEFYTHFAGVEHEAGNEKRVTPIKKGDLRFEPLAEYLVDNMPEITIISSSPLLEHDAMYMKVIFERVLTKKVAKEEKAKKSEKKETDDEEGSEESENKSSKKSPKKDKGK